MKYRMEVVVDVDDELLANHDGDKAPPPNDVMEWWGGDLVRALDEGIAEVVHEELPVCEPV